MHENHISLAWLTLQIPLQYGKHCFDDIKNLLLANDQTFTTISPSSQLVSPFSSRLLRVSTSPNFSYIAQASEQLEVGEFSE